MTITALTVVPYRSAYQVPGTTCMYPHGLLQLIPTASLGSQPHYYLHFIAEKTKACLTCLYAKQAGELGFESPRTGWNQSLSLNSVSGIQQKIEDNTWNMYFILKYASGNQSVVFINTCLLSLPVEWVTSLCEYTDKVLLDSFPSFSIITLLLVIAESLRTQITQILAFGVREILSLGRFFSAHTLKKGFSSPVLEAREP